MSERWAIVLALPHEAGSLLPEISSRAFTRYRGFKIWEGRLGRNEIVLLQSGMGPERAGKATAFLLEQFAVTHLLSTGYCGGLNSEIRNADAVIAESIVMDSDPGETSGTPLDATALRRARNVLEELQIPFYSGRLLTASRPILKVAEKQALAGQTGAVAVDMESGAVLKIASRSPKKIASLCVRFVVDALGDELTDTGAFLDAEARVKPLSLARELVRRPKLMMQLPGLERLASRARSNLTKFVLKFFSVD